MKRTTKLIGLLGIVMTLFGLMGLYLVDLDEYYFTHTHLVVGVLCLGWFILRGGLPILGRAAAKRAAWFGGSVTLYSSLFLALLGLLNYAVARHDPLHYDSTEQKVYTLAPQTLEVLNSLEHTVIIRAFSVGGKLSPELENLLGRLGKASKKIEWEVINPEAKPGLAQKYGISERETLHFSFDVPDSTREAKITRTFNEQEIVNAILKLTRGSEKKVYYLVGHGESDLEGSTYNGTLFLKEAIQGENLVLEKLALSETKNKVPEDASAILLHAPRRALLPAEIDAIKSYLAEGGNAILMSEPNTTADIAQLAAPLGIKVENDVVLDQLILSDFGTETAVSRYGEHPLTKGFNAGTVFLTASSVSKSNDVPAGADVAELAFTSANAWAEKSLALVFSDQPRAALDPEDKKGPVPLAAAFEGLVSYGDGASGGHKEQSGDRVKSRVVVFGDADFVTNGQIRRLFNRDFFLNALNWAIGEGKGVTIRARTLRSSEKTITAQERRAMFIFTGLLFPECIFIWGFMVWWFRKY